MCFDGSLGEGKGDLKSLLRVMTGAAVTAALWAPSGQARALEERCNVGEPGFVAGGYAVQANRWNSHGEICVTFGRGTSWTVSRSTMDWGKLQNGAPPGAYPNIGTAIADERLPLRIDSPQDIRTTWDITLAEGDYNASYDIWYHPDAGACRSNSPYIVANGGALEIMVWLNSPGIDPSPSWKIADGVTVGDRVYDLYKFQGPTGQVGLIYDMRRPTTRIEDFALKPFSDDAAARGFQRKDAYLCKVQAGFEVTRNGTGLRTNEFALHIGRGATKTPGMEGVPLPGRSPGAGSSPASPGASSPAPSGSSAPPSAAREGEKHREPIGFLLLGLPVIAGLTASAWWWRRGARR